MNSVLVLSGSTAVYEAIRSILGERASVEHGERLADVPDLLARRPADVVIVDTTLRDCEGPEALRAIAREHPGPALIALTLSAKLNGLPGDRSLNLFAYLTKPFEAEQVQFVVERALERAELRRRISYLTGRARPRQPTVSPAGPPPAEAAPADRHGEFSLFRRCARVFAREARVPALAAALADVLAEEFGVGAVAVLLWDHGSRRFAPSAAYGLDEGALAATAFCHGRGIAGWLAANGVVLRRDDAARTLDEDEAMTVARELELLRAEIAAPLLCRGSLVGFISLGRKISGRATSAAEIEWLALVASMAAAAIENARTRQALAFEKLCAERIVAGLDIGVVAADAEGTITACNRAAADALGLDRSPLGDGLRVLGPALSQAAHDGLQARERLGGREITHEATGRRLVVSAAPIAGEDGPEGEGGPAGVVLVLNEAGEPAAEGAPAERAEEMEFWSQLAGRMAHKIKNPLVSIKTFTQLLPERYGDDEFRKSFLDVVDAEADRINEVADRLVLYSSVHGSEPVPTDVRALIEAALDACRARLGEGGVRLERDLEEVPLVLADPEQLGLALRNIIENALDAMDEGGQLTVRTRLVGAPVAVSADDRLVLDFAGGERGGPALVAVEIADTGRGIPRETLGKVVQPFFSETVRGLGLGLAIVARIVREHRGRMEVTSASGAGTQVRLLLPSAR